MAPQLPVLVRELGRLHSASSFSTRLPDPLRPESLSLSVMGVSTVSSVLSEMGLMLPELLASLRRSRPARTILRRAERRVRATKFLLPSCLEVGFAFSSSIDGGCEAGERDAPRHGPGPERTRWPSWGSWGTGLSLGRRSWGAHRWRSRRCPLLALASELDFLCPRRKALALGGGSGMGCSMGDSNRRGGEGFRKPFLPASGGGDT